MMIYNDYANTRLASISKPGLFLVSGNYLFFFIM